MAEIHRHTDRAAGTGTGPCPLSCTVTDGVRGTLREDTLESTTESARSSLEPEQGCRLGGADGTRFELLERLGGGGMAVVFRAHDAVLDRTVAIKFLINKARSTNEGLERLQLEARACGRLNHENIVRLFDMGIDRGLPFLVLEYLEGRPLDAMLRDGELDARRAVRIMIDVARGLSQAHRAGIVHRDLKPSNVFIAKDGTAKILDFGVATMIAAPSDTSGALWGTPRYMSPEQWKGEAQDGRTDIWSAGVMFFQLMTGVEPFTGEDVFELRDRIVSPLPAPSLRALRPELPAEAERIAQRAMMKGVSDRFGTADELLDAFLALEGALHTRDERESRPKIERRQTTVLSCSLSGAPEGPRKRARDEVDESFVDVVELCAAIVQELDGTIVSSFGSRVLACFGYPIAHEDNAQRALHAAFRIVRAIQARKHEAGRPACARIGVSTNLSIVHRAERSTMPLMLQGDAPRMAQWLEERAGPDEILVGNVTHVLVRGSFDLELLGEAAPDHAACPAPVYRALRPLDSPSRFDRVARDTRTPLVGRDRELATLRAIWDDATAGRGQFVLMLGEAGIGKSRLIQQHLEQIGIVTEAGKIGPEPHAMVRCQCWPHFQNSALTPIVEGLRRALGLHRAASSEEKLSVLEEALTNIELPPREHAARLAALFGVPTGARDSRPPLDHGAIDRRMLDLLVTLLVHLAGRRPLILIVEDAHWSDSSTIDLLHLLLPEVAPARVMVIVTARPELEPRWRARSHLSRSPRSASLPSPQGWSFSPFSQLVLTKLSPKQTATMIALASRGHELSPAMAQQLVQRTDGVPLFIEELTHWIVDALGETEPRSGATDLDPLASHVIPATLEDLLRARLDALPSDAQDVAHLAAVLGREVPYELLGKTSELHEASLQVGLVQLLNAGILRKHGHGPEARYVFSHALVREAAYQSLVKRKRVHLHRRAAEVLVESFPELARRHPELVAAHFAEANAHELAVAYLEAAGQLALRRSAYADAAVHFERACAELRMLPADEAREGRAIELLLALGTVLILGGKPAVLADVAHRLAPHAERANDVSAKLLAQIGGAWSSLLSGHDLARCRDQAASALALHDLRGYDKLAPKFQGVGRGLVVGLCLIWSLALRGESERALVMARDTVQRARFQGDTLSSSLALFHLGYLHAFRGEFAEGARFADEVARISEQHGFEAHMALSKFLRGWSRVGMGDDDGVEELEQGTITRRKVGTEVAITMCLSVLAWAQWRTARLDDAMRSCEDAAQVVDGKGEHFFEPELLRLNGEILLAQGADPSRALACFERGLALARRQGARAWELRLAHSDARLRSKLGRHAEARARLMSAIAGFGDADDTSDVRMARALLGSLALLD
ncbi:protein kinase domain-containing protein [Pendulispora albinea]|uniref:Protein kinase n=1 Tax=Pendulispora albinea TaxID=2741071 RepID=A0ABZ2MA63_9BACT